MLRIEQLAASGAAVFNGCDYLNLYALIAGAVGCFSGGANAMPKESVQLYELFQAGRHPEALALWRRMQPLNRLLWTEPFNPIAKAATNLSGRAVGECRRPVLPLTPEQKLAVKNAMAALKRD
jgi:4-hydroxy-tetrahydrodipicolinate synthase